MRLRLRWRLAGVTVVLLAAALACVGVAQYALLRVYVLERTYQTLMEQTTIAVKFANELGTAPRIAGSADAYVSTDGIAVAGQDPPALAAKPGAPASPWVDLPPDQVRSLIGLSGKGDGKATGAGQLFDWLTSPPWATLRTPAGVDVMAATYQTGNGYLLLESPLTEEDLLLEADVAIYAATAGAALVAVATLAVWLTARALSPLERVAAVAREISRGEYDRRTGLRGAGEVASLSGAFDEMVDRLQERIRLERESEARMRRFLADASHELRTPVTGILGHLEVLRRGALNSRADLEESLAAMHLASERMARLVADLLTLTRFEQSEGRLRAEPVDVDELVRDAARAAQPSTREHVVALGPVAPGAAVLGDRDAAERILVNLLDNAAKYSPAGTRIGVAVRAAVGGAVEILVADRGPGVPEAERERIFERLYRGDRSRASGGAGLGLAISRALARAQSGDVSVRTAPGGGATFVVTLPCAGDLAPGRPVGGPGGGDVAPKHHVGGHPRR